MIGKRVVERAARRGDAQLLELVSQGDLDALGELYDRYARDVWRVARRVLGSGEDVEDVVHTLFMKLPDIARSYDGRAECRSWLFGIAVRISLRHRRSLGRFRRMLGAFAQTLSRGPAADGDPERMAAQHEELARFERALARLSAKKRTVFVLVELEGMTAEDAATALEIPAATARTRLFHARKELHEAMQEGGGE